MRLWSLHPKYLDRKGLVALWREGLLARKVLLGKTRGYVHHPQLDRFRKSKQPIQAIDKYLLDVFREGRARGSRFDRKKIGPKFSRAKVSVTRMQLAYEFAHLKEKLRERDPTRRAHLLTIREPRPHPLFRVVEGGIEPWERTK